MSAAGALGRIVPMGWMVTDVRGATALFLERPRADHFATQVHGLVDAVYSGAQLLQMMNEMRAGAPAAPLVPGMRPVGG